MLELYAQPSRGVGVPGQLEGGQVMDWQNKVILVLTVGIACELIILAMLLLGGAG